MNPSILKPHLLKWITNTQYDGEEDFPSVGCMAILENPKYREYCTKWMLGLNESSSVNGYDDDLFPIEVKTQHTLGKNKLTGSGKYSDLTTTMHQKYMVDNPAIYLAGFAYTKLMYIVHVPYISIADHIAEQLKHGRSRTPSFTFEVWKPNKHKIVYRSPFINTYAADISTKLLNHINTNA
jgi:hypothetical protein